MSRKIVVFIAASLDGYIATKEDSLDWLFATEGEGDNGYGEFLATVDTVVMGRRTYGWLLKQVGADNFPYRDKRCYVFSSTLQGKDGYVDFIADNVLGFVNRLRQEKGKNIWLVGGGGLIHTFAEHQLVDEWIVTVAPTILGDGIPLFHKAAIETRLSLKSARTFNQFVELHYETMKA